MQGKKMNYRVGRKQGRVARSFYRCLFAVLFFCLPLLGFNAGHTAQIILTGTAGWEAAHGVSKVPCATFSRNHGAVASMETLALGTDGHQPGKTCYFADKTYNTAILERSNQVDYIPPQPLAINSCPQPGTELRN